MTVARQADISESTRYFFDEVFHGEPMTVPRHGENAVILTQSEYEDLAKAKRNQEYLAMLDRGIAQMEAGNLQYHDLIEVD